MDKKTSCVLLRHQLIFMDHGVYPCCAINDGKNPRLSELSGDIDAMMQEIARNRQEIESSLNSGNPDCICHNCNFLQQIDANDNNQINTMIITEATHCNFRCNYCLNFHNGRNFDPPQAVMYEILTKFYKKGLLKQDATFVIAGGEPFLMPDFEKSIELILQSEKSRIDLRSNLSSFSLVMAKAMSLGRAMITTSLDSGTPQTFKKIKGVNKFWTVIKNARRYAQINPYELVIKFICLPENTNGADMLGLLDVLNQGFERLCIAFDCNHYDTTPYEFMDFAGELKARAAINGIHVEVDYGEGNKATRERHLRERVDASFSSYMQKLAALLYGSVNKQAASEEGESAPGFLEAVESDASGNVRMSGWAWLAENNLPPYVAVFINEAPVYVGKTYYWRADATKVGRAGFIFELQDKKLAEIVAAGNFTAEAYASRGKNNWYKLNKLF